MRPMAVACLIRGIKDGMSHLEGITSRTAAEKRRGTGSRDTLGHVILPWNLQTFFLPVVVLLLAFFVDGNRHWCGKQAQGA